MRTLVGAMVDARRAGLSRPAAGGPRNVSAVFDEDGAGPASTTYTFDEDSAANPSYVSYRFTAGATSLTVTISPLGAGSYHFYGASNELVSPESGKLADNADIDPLYCGPGVWYDRETGRIHARLSHTNSPAPVANYRGETDPRKLPLVLVHGELNPSNLVFKDGNLLAVIDWENAHIGDPREDLGWFRFMDAATGTNFFNSINYPGGFLGYYNHLTGYDITPEELNYFQVFAFNNVVGQGIAAIKRRIRGEHQEILHLYLLRIVIDGMMAFTKLLGYPAPEGTSV